MGVIIMIMGVKNWKVLNFQSAEQEAQVFTRLEFHYISLILVFFISRSFKGDSSDLFSNLPVKQILSSFYLERMINLRLTSKLSSL